MTSSSGGLGVFCAFTAASVNALTCLAQEAFQRASYPALVETLELNTAADRIRFAVAQSGKTLEVIAAEIGCSHATLSQWQTGSTNLANIKSGLLLGFAEATGFDVRWLITGHGPRVSRYIRTADMERIASAIRAMERQAPLLIEPVVRMVEAAAEQSNRKP